METSKRKNSGFTLIEILAAIIIIGVISLIGVVSISRYIENSRKSSFLNIARMYVEEAQNMKARDELLYDPKDKELVLVPFSSMDLDHSNNETPYGTIDLEKSYVLIINEFGDISYYVAMVDSSYHALVLEDANTMDEDSIKSGTDELGLIPDITDLKNDLAGLQLLERVYQLSDKNVENGSQLLLESSVLSSFRVEYNRDWFNADKKITVVAEEESMYYLSERNMKPTRNDSLWQSSNEFMRDLGTYFVFVKGKDGEISDSKKVIIDKIDRVKPSCKLKATGRQNSSGIFIGDAIVTFETVTDGATSSTTSGVRRYGIGSLEGENFKVHSISGPNEVKYVGYIEDKAGNQSTCEITVRSDAIEPILEYSVPGGNYNTNQSVVVTARDDDSGIDYYHVHVYKDGAILNKYENLTTANHTVVLDSNGTYEIRAMAVDKAGNKINKEPNKDGWYYQTYVIDKDKPTLTVSAISGYYKTSASLQITVAETGGSGLSSSNKYQYCLSTNGSSATGCDWTNYTSETLFTISGTNTIKYLFVYPVKDNAGNINGSYTNNTTPYLIGTYVFDSTKPTLTISAASGNYTTSASIKITVADTGGSGLSSSNKYQYCLSTSNSSATGCTWTNYTSGTNFTISGTNTKRYLFVYPVEDNAGNINGSYTNNTTPYLIGTYVFDSTKPTLTISASGLTVKLTAADTGGSGLSSANTYKYCLSTSSSSVAGCTWTNYTSGTNFTLSGSGTRYLFVYPVKDNSGNVNDGKTFGTPYMIKSFSFCISTLTSSSYTYTGSSQLINDGNGNWRIKFLTSGTFKLTSSLCLSKIDVFLVGGGGGGGADGGGGGGGYTATYKSIGILANQNYSITIGNGGARGTNGATGGNTSGFGYSVAGGTGGSGYGNGGNGGTGGSGGASYAGGGNAGGSNGGKGAGDKRGGGQGITTREFGESAGTLYAGGGGSAYGGAGGSGGGGTGGRWSDSYPGSSGAANTGGGGGGYYGGTNQGAGGSGILVIRNARSSSDIYTYTGSSEYINDGNGNWRIKFLTSGIFKFNTLPSSEIDVFLVGGGGGGGADGGGGGGGYTATYKSIGILANQNYSITIGNGGARGTNGATGGNTSGFGYSVAGGTGGNGYGNGGNGGTGGSGGASYAGGGNAGGSNGGKGAGDRGGSGQGKTTREFGESTGALYAGGGGSAYGGAGGSGGGGTGGRWSDSYPGGPGIPNTGGGGGGHAGPGRAGSGGSGIVIIRNKR